MRKLIFFMIIVLFYVGSQGQTVKEYFDQARLNPQPVRLTPEQVTKISQIALQNTIKENPDFFFRKISAKQEYKVGEQRDFYAINMETNNYYRLTATLKAEGNMSRIWVENASLDSGYVDDNIIAQILDRLENHTIAESIDSTKGILEIDTTYFGQPPNVDGDGIVDFLILDIKDGWEPGQGFIAGYFSPNDQNPSNQGSNGMDLLYIDAMPGIYYNGHRSTRTVMGTTAHEFQHLIHYNYDPAEMTFFNEAMSQLAATYCGYGVDDPYRYFNNTNVNLINWNGTLADYSRANLFSLYLVEQFGVDFIRQFVQSSLQGPTAINNILTQMGYSERFGDIYQSFLICNILNDTTVHPKFGYKHPEMQNVRANSQKIVSFPASKSGNIVQYGATYYNLKNGENLSVTPTLNGAYAQLIQKGSNVNIVNLSDGQTYADSSFGSDYNEGIIVIGNLNSNTSYSVDINATMNVGIIELTYDDGTPDQFGDGFTYLTLGDSAAGYGWLVKYVMPENTENFLYGFSVLVGSLNNTAQGEAQIRVFSSKNGKPYEDIMSPYDVTFSTGWNDINLAELAVNLPDTFFIGFTHKTDQSYIAVGMDNSIKHTETYLIRPNGSSDNLGELGADYAGYNMMMRAQIAVQNSGAPEFHTGLLQNPLLRANGDLAIVNASPLDKSSLEAWHIFEQDTIPLLLNSLDEANRVFTANGIDISNSGTHRIRIVGKNIGSQIIRDTIITLNVVYPDLQDGVVVSSPDHALALAIPQGAFEHVSPIVIKEGFNTVSLSDLQKYDHPGFDVDKVYSLIFSDNELKIPLRLKILSRIHSPELALMEDGKLTYLPLTPEGDYWVASVSKSGNYVLLSQHISNEQIVKQFKLHQNYPNPFNPVTTISVDIPEPGNFELSIFNILGQKIRTLFRGNLEPAYYKFDWDGRDENGRVVPNGIYIYQANYNGKTFSRKMVFLK